ncbi:LacI family transcriptional regulator [Streptomyces xanthochromogenes]|uniref:substrate-binding domain-containing protein n=1 Tax=Streptomyces xanthochromogenes TaxID=67384 RepID=UPI00167222EB|nr:substrate-binding domain-containing protein [Streptomyces xanthochromogenes]GHB49175.1 LacI family transcriptional regulator [Streptomyces xanthochromogenes]
MHAEDRHQAILRRLRERGSLRVTDFAEELKVSAVTVRRDVEALAERGLVARVHGGALLPEVSSPTAAQPPPPAGPGLVFGLVVPTADYYYPEVIRGAREAAAARGVRLVLGLSQYSPDEERAQVRQLLAHGIDGLLIAPCGTPGAQDWLAALGVPFVLVERRSGDDVPGAERVVTDHAHGARLAVRHLADSGRGRIGLLLRADSPHSALVQEGYLAGLASLGLPAPPSLRFTVAAPETDPVRREAQLDAFTQAVEADLLDAALVHNDHDAIVLLPRLRVRGLSVPGDVALVAYDDEVAALADIPLTAVAPPKRAVGVAAVDLLALRVTDPGRPRHHLSILPDLNVRASST